MAWLCLCLALLTPPAVRADSPLASHSILPVSGAIPAGRSPLVALDVRGQPQLLWAERVPEGGLARLMLALSPKESPVVLSEALPLEPLGGLSPQHPGYALAAGDPPWVAWAMPEGDGRVVVVASPGGDEAGRWQVPAEAALWTFGLDGQGDLVGAWWEPGKLSVHHSGQGITLSLTVDVALTPERLQLALDGQGQGYVAWSARGTDAGQSGLWYAPLVSGATSIPAAPEGILADVALGPDGALHLVWFGSEGLYYANNQTRDGRRLVEPGLPAGAPVALAAGSRATAHLAWLRDGQLWYSASADWDLARTLLHESEASGGLGIGLDGWNAPRLVWAQADEAGAPSLHLLRPFVATPQLEVTWPLDGQVVTGDTVAQAAANCPAADWLRVEFYLQEDGPSPEQFGALRELGIDRDGADGWQVMLPVGDLDPTRRYRVVALGYTAQEGMRRTEGGWFQANSAEELWLWAQPSLAEASGEIMLAIAPPEGTERLARLDLYLTPYQAGELEGRAPAAHYVSLRVQGSLERPSARLDTRTLPDGTYRLEAKGYTVDGEMIAGRGSRPLTINNSLAPTLTEVTAIPLDAVTGEAELEAIARDPHRQPARVGFYLQKATATPFRGIEPGMADLMWAGLGEPTDVGWRARLFAEPSWYDESWFIWAHACDEQERCAWVRSDSAHVIWPSQRPALLIAQPTVGQELRGVETIRLAVAPDASQVLSATVWLEQPEGDLLPLGDLAREEQEWLLTWDTAQYADASYRLLIWAILSDGSQVTTWGGPYTLLNRQPNWRFAAPAAGQRVRGLTPITVAPLEGALPIEWVAFYVRDAQGALSPLGEARPQRGQWSLLWNTHAILDGKHVLVAELGAAQGEVYYLEHAVEVQNARPSIALLQGPGADPVNGVERTVWYAQHPAGQPMTVTVEYSPDAGGHWMPLAQGLPEGVSLTWDSARVPDSDAAYLRVTATDGVYARQVTHGPFVVANANDPPHVILLRPRPGETLGRKVTIAWQATDAEASPHAQEIRVALYVRAGEEPWRLLAEGLPGTGRYEWDTTEQAPGTDYTLRIVARDPLGGAGADLADGLTVVDNVPPEVELVWPNDHVRLSTEAVILWRAADPDGDALAVDLYYSDNGGLTWFPLAEDLRDGGYYVWQVAFLPPGSAYRLKVIARDGYFATEDEGRGLIALGDDPPPQIELLSPVAGSALTGAWPIRWWTAGAASDEVEIDILSRISGWEEWRPVVEGLGPQDLFLWDPRRYSGGTYELVARARLGSQRSLSSIIGPLQVLDARGQPPPLELVSPTGGELWAGLHEVRWELRAAGGRALEAHVELSPDAGLTWHTLARVNAAQERWLWQTDEWPAGHRYLLRVTVSDGETTAVATSPGAFGLVGTASAPPHILITSPNPWGVLAGGDLITWIAEDADGDPLLIDISLSEDDGQTWSTVASRLLNTGEYALDRSLTSDQLYRVALVASDGLHSVVATSRTFSGGAAEGVRPSVSLLAPAQDAVVSGEVSIQWQAADPTGLRLTMEIAYSADGGQTWLRLARGLENSGRYIWDTSSLANGTYLLRLTADNGRLRQSAVGEPFRVANAGRHAPYLSWVKVGSADPQVGVRELLWRAWDADGDRITLDLAYSVGPYGPWLSLDHDLANTGRYVWDPAALPSTADLWLRLTATDGRFYTTIISQGPLAAYHPASPRVAFVAPAGGELWTGEQPIRWWVTHGGGLVNVLLQRSLDGGMTWEALGTGLPAVSSYLWDTAQVPDGSSVLLRILAMRGGAEGVAILPAPIAVVGNESRDLFPLPFR